MRAPSVVPAAAEGCTAVGSLTDVLDRLLERGVALKGDLVVSVADVDLVWLGLRAVVAGMEHAPPDADAVARARTRPAPARSSPTVLPALPARPRPSRRAPQPGAPTADGPRRQGLEEGRVEDGLVRLVLSVVELVRQVLERQALRRVDGGGLDEDQVERLGVALMRLDERMEDLKGFFGLGDDDLELRLDAVQATT